MCGVKFIDWWTLLMGALATIALIVIGLGLMVRKLQPADAAKYGAGYVGIAVVLTMLVKLLVSFWCGMSLWQHFLLFVAVLVLWQWRRKSQQPQKRKEE
jgi:uncharacterized membrane protein YhaH (DUF805 family)